MNIFRIAILVTMATTTLSLVSCDAAKYRLVKKEADNPPPDGPPESDPIIDFEIEGPTEGEINVDLSYKGKGCDQPEEIVWRTSELPVTGTGPDFTVQFPEPGKYDIVAKCGDIEVSITVTITDPDDPDSKDPNQSQNQNQNQNQN